MIKDPQRISQLIQSLCTFAQMTGFGFKLHYTKKKAKYTGMWQQLFFCY